MGTEGLFKIIESKKDYYLKFLKEIVELESPTSYKAGVDAVGKYFIEKAAEHNWKTEIFEQKTSGNVVVITMNADSKKEPFCLSGHIDTVHPVGAFGKPCVKFENGKITGPGICDCKGGCVTGFWAMDALSEIGYTKRPVMLLLQSDEETSSLGSNKETVKYIVERSKDAVAFFNLEPCYSKTGVTLERKGIAKFELIVSGISTHASQCYNGASAIAEAANIILQLEKHKDKDGITFNCGTISGGTVPNVVPDKCIFTLDARFKDMKQYEEVRSIINRATENKTIGKTSCEIREISLRAPMPKTEKNYSLLNKANKILNASGLEELEVINSTGGSDAAYITLAGIPVIDSFGVLGGKVHSPKEYIMTDSFSLSAKRIVAIIAYE